MTFWFVVALAGGFLSLIGVALLVRDYRRDLLTGLELSLLVGTYLLIVGAVVVTEVFWQRPAGVIFLLVMMPFWFGIASRARRRHITGEIRTPSARGRP